MVKEGDTTTAVLRRHMKGLTSEMIDECEALVPGFLSPPGGKTPESQRLVCVEAYHKLVDFLGFHPAWVRQEYVTYMNERRSSFLVLGVESSRSKRGDYHYGLVHADLTSAPQLKALNTPLENPDTSVIKPGRAYPPIGVVPTPAWIMVGNH